MKPLDYDNTGALASPEVPSREGAFGHLREVDPTDPREGAGFDTTGRLDAPGFDPETRTSASFDPADLWLASLAAAGRSPKTIEGYAYAVGQLRAWRTSRTSARSSDISELTRLEALAFVRSLTDRYMPGGVESRVKRLRALWSWLVVEELAPVNVFARIHVSVPPKDQPAVSDEVLEAMLASAKGRRRDTAIITCFADTGCRKEELARIEWSDVDLRSGVLQLRVSKTRARSVPLSDRAVVALGRWHMAWFKAPGIGTGRGAWKSDDPYSLMVATTKRHSNGVVTPHQLRRRFATNWLLNSGSEVGLMRICGWSSRAMILTYTAASAEQLAHEEMRRLMS